MEKPGSAKALPGVFFGPVKSVILARTNDPVD